MNNPLNDTRFGTTPAMRIAGSVARALEVAGPTPQSFTPGELSAYHSTFKAQRIAHMAPLVVRILRANGYEAEWTGRHFTITRGPTG